MRVLSRSLLPLFAVLGLLAGALPAAAAPPGRVRPLAQAHAHNDYEHDRPLHDALGHGFTSVEADIYLVAGELLVGHDPDDLTPERTLRSLYLDPLRQRVIRNGGSVYFGHRGPFQLLIDIKSDGPSTYAAIDKALEEYRNISTIYANGRAFTGAVTSVISGNRPLDVLKAQKIRYAGYDGRLSDLNSKMPASLMPLVSDNWSNNFTWRGIGPFPVAERAKLREIVTTAHHAGYRVRFWETPDTPGAAREAVWSELVAAGVDHLNTDDLHGLEDFLRG